MLAVAIVGGGPAGLISSILLSMRGIENCVFEQYPGTSIHPKACGLNHRTVEIFRHIGVEQEVIDHRAPLNTVGRTAWYTDIGPAGREIHSRDAWGGGKYQEEYLKLSPTQYSTLAQIRLEPILQRRAQQLSANSIRYSSKVTNVREQTDCVTFDVQSKDGTMEQIQARYLLGADGGRGLAEDLGIGWTGARELVEMVTAHFKADITSIHPDKRVFISWLMSPSLNGSRGAGVLYHLGPYHPAREAKEEWMFAAPRHTDDPVKFDNATMVQRIRKSLQLTELDVDLLSVSHWTVDARVADRYRSVGGRIFLVGDACHRVPPWGALGLNTGIQDAHNLIWKLGFAIKSGSMTRYNGLLNTYQDERKGIAECVARNSLLNMRNHASVMDRAVGIDPNATIAENLAAVDAYFDPTHCAHSTKRAAVQLASEYLDQEFHALGIEIGWFYPSADINAEGAQTHHDGQLLDDEDSSLKITEYHPSTIPGHHVPHAWLRKDTKTLSTLDLVQSERFVLLTQSAGVWNQVRGELVEVCVIGSGEDQWRDSDGAWAELCGVQSDGAVLVRPDGIVAWRAKAFTPDALAGFQAVLDKIMRLQEGDAKKT